MVDYQSFERLYRAVGELNSKAQSIRNAALKQEISDIAGEVGTLYQQMMARGLKPDVAVNAKLNLGMRLTNLMNRIKTTEDPDAMMLFQSVQSARSAAAGWQAGGIAAVAPYQQPMSGSQQMLAEQMQTEQQNILRDMRLNQPPAAAHPEAVARQRKGPAPAPAPETHTPPPTATEEELLMSLPYSTSSADEAFKRIGMVLALNNRIVKK